MSTSPRRKIFRRPPVVLRQHLTKLDIFNTYLDISRSVTYLQTMCCATYFNNNRLNCKRIGAKRQIFAHLVPKMVSKVGKNCLIQRKFWYGKNLFLPGFFLIYSARIFNLEKCRSRCWGDLSKSGFTFAKNLVGGAKSRKSNIS